MRYFIYCRKSSEAEDRQVLSIDSQLAELRRAFEGRTEIEIAAIYQEAYSAKAPGRPVFSEMLQRIERGEAGGIIAWHPDRLARNSVDGGRIIYLLDRKALQDLKFASFTFENNPQGKFMLSIIFGYSKYYVDSLSENVKRGNRAKLALGWRPNHAPLGYKNDRETKTIVLDPDAAPIVRRIFDLALTQGLSARRICMITRDEWGYRTPKRKRIGGVPLAVSSVHKMLTNPFYMGLIKWDSAVHRGRHPPLVTASEFAQVQQRLRRNTRPHPEIRTFPFRGMIRCGSCGLSVTAEEKVNRYGYRYIYYHCSKRKLGSRCREPSLEIKELERQIADFIRRLSIPRRMHQWALRQAKACADDGTDAQAQGAALQKSADALDAELSNLTRLRIREMIDDAEFSRERMRIAEEKLKIEQTVARLTAPKESWFEPAADCFSFVNWAADCFAGGDAETKSLILETVGSNLALSSRKLSIEATKPFFVGAKSTDRTCLLAAVDEVRTFWTRQDLDFLRVVRNIRYLMGKHGHPLAAGADHPNPDAAADRASGTDTPAA